MMFAKLSSEFDVIRSTPLIPPITSSIGSITSRSTVSGEAPGYGIETTTTGALISGNSSVSSCISAATPKTTIPSIATTVRIGRLIAVSEMNIEEPVNSQFPTADAHPTPKKRVAQARLGVGHAKEIGSWELSLRHVDRYGRT